MRDLQIVHTFYIACVGYDRSAHSPYILQMLHVSYDRSHTWAHIRPMTDMHAVHTFYSADVVPTTDRQLGQV